MLKALWRAVIDGLIRNGMMNWKVAFSKNVSNRPFPSSVVPLFQNESKCETFHMKMSSACSLIFMQIKVIFIRMVSHLDSLWNRGTRELGNGPLKTKTQKPYPFSDQNGQNPYPIYEQNGWITIPFRAAHNYIAPSKPDTRRFSRGNYFSSLFVTHTSCLENLYDLVRNFEQVNFLLSQMLF